MFALIFIPSDKMLIVSILIALILMFTFKNRVEMSNYEIYLAIAIMAIVNYFTRVFPFLFLEKMICLLISYL